MAVSISIINRHTVRNDWPDKALKGMFLSIIHCIMASLAVFTAGKEPLGFMKSVIRCKDAATIDGYYVFIIMKTCSLNCHTLCWNDCNVMDEAQMPLEIVYAHARVTLPSNSKRAEFSFISLKEAMEIIFFYFVESLGVI